MIEQLQFCTFFVDEHWLRIVWQRGGHAFIHRDFANPAAGS